MLPVPCRRPAIPALRQCPERHPYDTRCASTAYVPGAHDPASTTVGPGSDQVPLRLTPHSCNVHGRCLRIAPGVIPIP